jgi:hypothetical protein
MQRFTITTGTESVKGGRPWMFMSENHIHVLHFLGIQIPPNDYPYISRKEETRAHECSLHYVEWPPYKCFKQRLHGTLNFVAHKTMRLWLC